MVEQETGLGAADGCFPVLRRAVAASGPSECPLDDPSTSDDDETLHPWHAPDDLRRDVGLIADLATDVPVPGALSLLLGGVAVIGLARSRKTGV
jgi:hypothetical protein